MDNGDILIAHKDSVIYKLQQIQIKLKAPKNQYNSFGGFDYRSCEDIYEAVKPYLKEYDLTLIMTDDLVQIGDRYYIKATAKLTNGLQSLENSAYAREDETKKGMDGSQITGAASSYARKIALNGLFLIDDVRDSDGNNADITNEDRLKLMSRMNELELELDIPHEKTLDVCGVKSNNQMTNAQLQECVNNMEKLLKGKKK